MDLVGLGFLCLACPSLLLVGSRAPWSPQAQARQKLLSWSLQSARFVTLKADLSLGGHSGETVTVGKGPGTPSRP